MVKKICLSCKLDLVSGRPHSTYAKKSGRPQTKQAVGFVYACSKCHSEVWRTNKKHRCLLASTKIFFKEILNDNLVPNNYFKVLFKEDQPFFHVNECDLLMH